MTNIQILRDLTSDILVSMFYLIPETQPEAVKENFEYAANIRAEKLDIIMMFCKRTAALMAENFLGTDEITDQDICDTLKECINIIAGNFIGKEYPESSLIVPIPTITKNIKSVNTMNYEKINLYYNEEPTQILVLIE